MLLFKSVSSFCFHSSLRLISQPSNHSSIHPPAVAVAATQPKTRVLINSSVLLTSISRESIEYSVQHHRITQPRRNRIIFLSSISFTLCRLPIRVHHILLKCFLHAYIQNWTWFIYYYDAMRCEPSRALMEKILTFLMEPHSNW